MPDIVVDSGPLIALFDGSDRYHQQARQFLQQDRGTLHTNVAVITEVSYLLDFSTQAQCVFLSFTG